MVFKQRLINQEVLHGVIACLHLSCVTEMLSSCGFDWLWIDMEHSPMSLFDVQHMIQSIKKPCASLVRIPKNTEEWIERVLDLGPDGIIVPHVNTVEELQRALRASYYPPQGERGSGMARASSYGIDRNYKKEANDKRMVFIQIEHREGVKNIEAIASTPGLDGILIGPYDLSGSYGKMGEVHDPEVEQAIAHVLKTCKRSSKPIGIFAKEASVAKKYVQQGFQLVATGVDLHYLWNGAKTELELVKTP